MGVMGFHSFLQKKGIAFEERHGQGVNLKIFKHVAAKADEASLPSPRTRRPARCR